MKRLQIDLSEAAMARLEWLKEQTDAMSLTEVVRKSLKLREAIIKLKMEGKELLVEDTTTGQRERLIV